VLLRGAGGLFLRMVRNRSRQFDPVDVDGDQLAATAMQVFRL
jgi:hypothetical protein